MRGLGFAAGDVAVVEVGSPSALRALRATGGNWKKNAQEMSLIRLNNSKISI